MEKLYNFKKKFQAAVTIPVMAKCRIGHFVEAQILEALEVDYVDESEVLTPADNANHIWKHPFKVPFVAGARCLGQALRRIGEGAAIIRTKGDAGSGNVVEAVTHVRAIQVINIKNYSHTNVLIDIYKGLKLIK
jgi:pyridoxal 5'-phosphate synthase pdxS subunit